MAGSKARPSMSVIFGSQYRQGGDYVENQTRPLRVRAVTEQGPYYAANLIGASENAVGML